MEDDAQVVYKIIIVGDAGVGKTSLARRFVTGMFDESYLFTLGVDFFTKELEIKGFNVKLVLYDTGGQERFDFIRGLYFEGAAGCVITYDITDRASFERVGHWMQQVQQRCQDIPLLLVGNKVDLKDQRVVDLDEGKNLAKTEKLLFYESSAKTDFQVTDIFEALAIEVWKSFEKKGKPWDKI